jgi:hypothetical protein
MEGVHEHEMESGAGDGPEAHDDKPSTTIRLKLQLDDEELRLGVLEGGEGDAPQTVSKESVEEDLSKLQAQLAGLLGLQHYGKVADQNRCYPVVSTVPGCCV